MPAEVGAVRTAFALVALYVEPCPAAPAGGVAIEYKQGPEVPASVLLACAQGIVRFLADVEHGWVAEDKAEVRQ